MEYLGMSVNQIHPPLMNWERCGSPGNTVSLNAVLKQAISQIKSTIEADRVIIRCDSLPTLEANKDEFEKLFQNIFLFILKQPPVNSKQFLYVQCGEEAATGLLPIVKEGYKTYTIQFHFNAQLDEYWQLQYKNEINECNAIAGKYNGGIHINTMNSGCLLTLCLSGKPL